jgi:hypothetical protein
MAISGFGRGKGGEGMSGGSAPGPAPSSNSGGLGGLTAFIDQGSEFEGKLSFKDTVRIDGRFRGEISSENTLIVGESGEIHRHAESIDDLGAVTADVVRLLPVHFEVHGRVGGGADQLARGQNDRGLGPSASAQGSARAEHDGRAVRGKDRIAEPAEATELEYFWLEDPRTERVRLRGL